MQETLEWRKEFGVDIIVKAMENGTVVDQNEESGAVKSHDDDSISEMRAILAKENETGKIYLRGYDAEGRALMYMRPARENTNDQLNNMRHLVWNLEKAIAATRRRSVEVVSSKNKTGLATNGNDGTDAAILPLEKINLLIDYQGFRMRDSPPLSTSRYTLDILQKHYPERMYRAYVLNPPLVFRTFWTIVRPFVDPTTKQKIVFCSGKGGLAKLTDHVTDKDKLEECAGGTTPARDFDTKEYVALPLNLAFDD
jgi:CRAL/TRIO domain